MMEKQKLFIKNLKVDASVGVYEKEKNAKQKVIFDVEILLEKSTPPVKDDLIEVTDYSQFRRIILDTVKNKHYNLIEKLAYDITHNFYKIKNVNKIKIRITKPNIFDDCEVSYEFTKS